MNDNRGGTLRSLSMRVALAGRTALERADQTIAGLAPKDRPGLVVFILHCVFADEAEIESGVIDPHERATPEALKRLIDYFRGRGYTFVSAADIDRGLAPGGLYAHLTFDDGLANNMRLIDLLAKQEAHATVFPSINHVREGISFWWNVVHRERQRRGQLANVSAEYAYLRTLPYATIEKRLRDEFGPDAFQPAGDLDRPLTVEELRELARSPWVEIGNHTLGHRILSDCTKAEAEAQIQGAQQWLAETLGDEPFFIAYPAGGTNDDVTAIARAQGLRLGVTVVPTRNRLPIDGERMQLGRFRIVFDDREAQRMRALRSSVQMTSFARGLVIRD